MSEITPQPGIMDIAPYVGGKSSAPGAAKVVKLSSNENPHGPSPKAIEAAAASLADLNHYPSTDHSALRGAIGEVHGLDPAQIICGAGSDEILHLLNMAYAGLGDEVVYPEHGFLMYAIGAKAAGATPVVAPERERRVDVDALLAACNERTRLVFIANPANPTGTHLGGNELSRLAAGLPPRALLVLDGAYAEFEPGYDGGASLVETRDNVIMTRTFSKLYGLGGLRIGWAYGPAEVIDVLNRVRGPFNLSGTQLAAGEAAVRDEDYAAWCLAQNTEARDWLAKALAGMGIPSDPSHANFILARFASPEQADAANAALMAEGLIVRQVGGYGFPSALRITVGDMETCKHLAEVLRGFMEGQG
ncbi:histidinol-phosphate transaminase [Alphaproteobacteria bacterium KMM 3653]|uniref:Histidinol-phosphate aminotransferase n=1 Tax=Harenicola maris TaxID=2841044 RepID=A0AAP2G882_9RHOB|nr:histidinol-phosphate transaminase [Harenicola maris]